jgi:hypothetical protein
MASKKKTEKKQAKSIRTAGKKVAPMRKAVKNKEKMAKSRVSPKKKLTRKKAAPRKAEEKTKADDKKITVGKTAGALKKQVRGKSQSVDTEAFGLEGLGGRAIGGFAGIVQYPKCEFGECRRVARGRKRVRGRRGEGRGRCRWR